MSQNKNLSDVIWKADIEDQQDYVGASYKTVMEVWKIAYNMVQRAEHQKAPAALIDRLKIINNQLSRIVTDLEEVNHLMNSVKSCFPEEPKPAG